MEKIDDFFNSLKPEERALIEEANSAIVGMMMAKPAQAWATNALKRPNPIPLVQGLWNEGELCCLFADSNIGKSILAMQYAIEIARVPNQGHVLYFDFELSDKQFQMRYTTKDEQSGRMLLYQFPPNLIRVEVDAERIPQADFQNAMRQDIEKLIIDMDAKVVIIDNLTWMCQESEKGGDAAALMAFLMGLKFKYNLSLMVIAHTPKRDSSRPITANDLAGSKKLFNFFDSVIAIGRSAKDDNLRYIKQLKYRAGEFTHGADNIIVCSIDKEDALLSFHIIGYANERDHLKELTTEDCDNQLAEVQRLKAEGRSIRDIARALGLSKSKVGRLVK